MVGEMTCLSNVAFNKSTVHLLHHLRLFPNIILGDFLELVYRKLRGKGTNQDTKPKIPLPRREIHAKQECGAIGQATLQKVRFILQRQNVRR